MKKVDIFLSAIYILAVSCVLINLYVLLNRSETIYYLRIYHLAVGALMILCGAVQIIFMCKAQHGAFIKLAHPYTIPRPTMVSAFALTAGIALGYAYFLVFNIAFSDCDKLIDATGAEEQWLEAIYNLLMIFFCVLTLTYIWQRANFGSQDNQFDLFTRKWVNVVLTIVWIKIVVFKGYLSYQELCQRKEISGYWCPVIQRIYTCDPENLLKGTQKIWYYLHKGLLNSAIISCASEFFPVMLVAHWLACGRAEQRADELIRRRQEKKSVRRMLHGMIGDVTKTYGLDPSTQHRRELPVLNISLYIRITLLLLACTTALVAVLRWFVGLYYSIRFDDMHKYGSMVNNYSECVAGLMQLLLFGILWIWTRGAITFKRFDPHHKAEARGDLVLIFGSAAFMTLKLILQICELHFQRADGFLSWDEASLRTFSLTIIQMSEWLQFLSLRRLMALHFEDVYATRHFLPCVTLVAIIVNWVGFGMTFFETNTIKYQLGLSEHGFSESTLISMIFTQTIYPADYLFCFTAAGCWTDVLLRYAEMGLFQLGPLMDFEELEELEHHHGHCIHHSVDLTTTTMRLQSHQARKRFSCALTITNGNFCEDKSHNATDRPNPFHAEQEQKPTINGCLKQQEKSVATIMELDMNHSSEENVTHISIPFNAQSHE